MRLETACSFSIWTALHSLALRHTPEGGLTETPFKDYRGIAGRSRPSLFEPFRESLVASLPLVIVNLCPIKLLSVSSFLPASH